MSSGNDLFRQKVEAIPECKVGQVVWFWMKPKSKARAEIRKTGHPEKIKSVPFEPGMASFVGFP